jgi:hypothetical protein
MTLLLVRFWSFEFALCVCARAPGCRFFWHAGYCFSPSCFIRIDICHVQTFTYEDADGKMQHKGIKFILEERGLWRTASGRLPIRVIILEGALVASIGTLRKSTVVRRVQSRVCSLLYPIVSYRILLEEARVVLDAQPDIIEQRKH